MKVLAVLLSLSILGFSGVCSAQEEETGRVRREVRSVEGALAELDWVASKIVVDTGGDEMTFTVPESTKITQGTTTIMLSDLNQNDALTVFYYNDGVSGLKAVEITDNSPLQS